MISSIANRTHNLNPFMIDEVVVMEDSPIMKSTIQEVIGGIGWQTRFVDNRREAIKLVQNGEAAYFILDNWIYQNKQEGFDTLEVIRQLDEQVFVTILTGHPDSRNEIIARRLKADLYKEKSADADNFRRDIEEIASAMLEHKKKIFNDIVGLLDKEISQLKQTKKAHILESDINLAAYNIKIQDHQWLENYRNQYVVFVDGELVDSDGNKSEILKRIRIEYPDKARFFTKVEEAEEKTIDLPSSLWFDELDINF